MIASYFKNFTASVVCSALVAAHLMPTFGYADGWKDAFTQEELDIIFGETEKIPEYIGTHHVVMSLEEAKQIEGELAPAVVWGLNTAGGALIGGATAWASGSSWRGIAIAAAAGVAGGLYGYPGSVLGGVFGNLAGIGFGSIGTAYACSTCHQAK